MNFIDGELSRQSAYMEEVPEQIDRGGLILNALLEDYGNEISALRLSMSGGGRPPENLRVKSFLESYGHAGPNSWFLAHLGGPLTKEDIENHPCKELIGCVSTKVQEINDHLEKNCPEEAYTSAEKLQTFLRDSAGIHKLRHNF